MILNALKSLRGLFQVTARDIRLARCGARLGWYTRTYYTGRIESRLGKASSLATTRLNVNRVPLKLFVTPQLLGTLTGVFLDGEYNLSDALPGFNPARILDLGANVGMAAAYLHAFYPNAEFICVEPDPRNQPLLEQTLAANSLRATVVRAAVAAEPGTLRLRMGVNPSCSALETSPMHVLESTTEVDVVTVPDLLDRAAWPHVDLLKIDIEGTEQELLSRNNEWLSRVKAIVLEIHPNTSCEEITRFVKPYGFELTRCSHGTEPVYLAVRK